MNFIAAVAIHCDIMVGIEIEKVQVFSIHPICKQALHAFVT